MNNQTILIGGRSYGKTLAIKKWLQQQTVKLHTLPAMTKFNYRGHDYQTITELKNTVITRSQRTKREVMNTKTYTTTRFRYFANVLLIS